MIDIFQLAKIFATDKDIRVICKYDRE